jgi:GT2 family glycosyltransferase
MANIAVAILNFNGAEHLKTFLPSVVQHSGEAEIIIGDNNSTDNSLEILKREFPQVRVIELDRNYGYAGGYNQLISQIDSEYIILANSDIEVTKNWIAPLATVLDKDNSVAAVQPKVLSYINRKYFEYAGAGGGFMDKYGYPFCRGRIFNSIEEDQGQYDDDIPVFWASGACFMIRKSAFDEIGGFDASFFAHMEEIDLNWRLQNAGYSIKYTGKSVVYHLGGGTLAYDNPRKTFLNFRNGWLMLIKNLTEYNRPAVFLKRYCLDLISILFFLLQFKAMSALAVIKAHCYILFNLSQVKKSTAIKSTEAKNNYKIQPENYSIVWQYFIRKIRKYSSL